MIGPLVEGLNPEQRRAVESDHPRILTIAGAGAGKTAVLTRRVTRLLADGVGSQRILALTFTRKAAAEMKERITALMEAHGIRAAPPEVRTIHSWGAQMLRSHAAMLGRTRAFTIYDEVDEVDVMRACAAELGRPGAGALKLPQLRKDTGVLVRFRRRLAEANALTFEGVEHWTLKLLAEQPRVRDRWTGQYRHILIDEYQDTNVAQAAILGHLGPENLYIVGDPRQSIYRFRGARVETILEHARDHDYEVIELTRNYRSMPAIVELGNHMVSGSWQPMTAQRAPTARAHRVVVERAVRSEADRVLGAVRAWQAHGYRPHAMAVLGRTWRTLETIRDYLDLHGIPTLYYGKTKDPWATLDGRAFARTALLGANPLDDGLAELVAEWGAVGRSRFDDIRSLRAQATKRRRGLLDQMAALSPEWAATVTAWGALRAEEAAPSAYAEAAAHHLGVLREYRERGLVTRLRVLEGCAARAREIGDTFTEWWTDRGAAERSQGACETCSGTGVVGDEPETGACGACEGTGERQGVHLLTVHAAKGLEWPCVAVIGVVDGVYPERRSSTGDDDVAEDGRVLYVAVTRARDSLLISCPEVLVTAGGAMRASPSPFLPAPEAPCPCPSSTSETTSTST